MVLRRARLRHCHAGAYRHRSRLVDEVVPYADTSPSAQVYFIADEVIE